MKDVGLWFSLLVIILSGFGIRAKLTSENELRNLLSSPIF